LFYLDIDFFSLNW